MNSDKQGGYTSNLSDLLWSIDFEDDPDVLKPDFFKEHFRLFDERLISFLNICLNDQHDAFGLSKLILTGSAEQNIKLNRNTVINWLTGNTVPRYGDKDRDRLYMLAFSLNLDHAQTCSLFSKVLFERPFNYRNVREFIYHYCLLHRMPYSACERIFSRINIGNDNDGEIIPTQLLVDNAERFFDEEELIYYINSYPRNFQQNLVRATQILNLLLEELKGKDGLAYREYMNDPDRELDEGEQIIKGKSPDSLDCMLAIIKNVPYASVTAEIDLSENENLGKLFINEISTDFPSKSTFAQKQPSAYIMRKEIIFLQFYKYFAIQKLDHNNKQEADIFEDFRGQMDALLDECGLPVMYSGNPYDWLFLHCAASLGDPLNAFRALMCPYLDDD